MTKAQASRKARKLWGKRALIEQEKLPGTREEIEAASAEYRRQYGLGKESFGKWSKTEEGKRAKLLSFYCSGPYKVGHLIVIAGVMAAFSVRGTGWTWEEAFAKAEKALV